GVEVLYCTHVSCSQLITHLSSSDKHFPLPILALIQAVLYTAVWVWDEYVASYLTLILPGVLITLLILSLIAEWIEPSRMPRWYIHAMLVSIAVPVVIGLFIYILFDGRIDWLQAFRVK